MMLKEGEIISDEEIEKVHANANFGNTSKRDVVRFATLKAACGYFSGATAMQIIREHNLIDSNYKLTNKGRAYLWVAFGKDCV